MSFQLRPYQTEIIEKTRSLMHQGCRAILVQAPTGSGKTALTAFMLGSSASKGMASWFVVHRRELIKQSTRTFSEVGIPHGIISAGFFGNERRNVQIASIQTLARRHEKLKRPKLVIWDEAHHIAAGSWTAIHKALPTAYHIGLTATPERLDGKGLDQWFQEMITGPSTANLIGQGFLAPYTLYAPSRVNLSGIHTRMGDFAKDELAMAVDKPTITGDALRHYQRLADGRRAVVFCVSIQHSEHVVKQFQAAGIPAAHVDGETNVFERDLAIKQFESGEIKVLSNVELFGEGFDLPAIEVAILLRPTQSLGLYLQQVGRVLRPCAGKVQAIILDHVGNCERHGLPDEERTWSLRGRGDVRRRGDAQGPAVRICPKCFAAQFPGAMACKFCGYEFPKQPRQVEQVEGDLVQVDRIAKRRQTQEQGMANTFDALVALGRQRGYKRPYAWASYIWRARQAKKLAAGRR